MLRQRVVANVKEKKRQRLLLGVVDKDQPTAQVPVFRFLVVAEVLVRLEAVVQAPSEAASEAVVQAAGNNQ